MIGDLYERGEFPYQIVARMGEMGLFGLPFPEEYGGMGGDYFALCLALEELARVDSSVAITLEAGVGLGAMPIYRYGSEAQKQEWLPRSVRRDDAGRLWPDRARRRVGCRRHPHHGPAGGRGVGGQRDQVVYHQLGDGHHRSGDGHGGDRRRHGGTAGEAGDLRHHRAGGNARLRRIQEVLEGRVDGVGHEGAVVRGLPGAGGQSARGAGTGLRPVSADPRRGPHRHRRPVGGVGPGLHRRVRPLSGRAGGLRAQDR